jgi:hypothetical protein
MAPQPTVHKATEPTNKVLAVFINAAPVAPGAFNGQLAFDYTNANWYYWATGKGWYLITATIPKP